MAVVETRRVARGRSGGDSVEKGTNNLPLVTRRFTEHYVVEVDDPTDSWDVVKHALPDLSTKHPDDVTAKVVDRSGTQQDNARLFWDCDIEYSTESPSANEGGEPESEQVERELRQTIRWSTTTVAQALTHDIDGEPILNAAGDPFDASQDVPIYVVNITRYETQQTFSQFPIGDYNDSVNEDTFSLDGKTININWALFAGYDAIDVVLGAQQAKQVTYTLMIWPLSFEEDIGFADISKWDAFLLEHGPNYLSGGVKRAAQEGGFRYNVNLNKLTGEKLAVDADPQFSHFRTRKRAPFGALGFRP